MTPRIDHILVARLLQFYDPFYLLFDRRPALDTFEHVPVQRYPWAGGIYRTPSRQWHLGRVRFFLDAFRAGQDCDPLDIDNHCDHGYIYGPIVDDGHHRLCAAVLARRERVPVFYSGRLDTLRFLTGQRQTAPEDLR